MSSAPAIDINSVRAKQVGLVNEAMFNLVKDWTKALLPRDLVQSSCYILHGRMM